VLFQRFFPSFFILFPFRRNPLYHHHQILPTGLKRIGIFIKNRQFETPRFQFHVIDYQTTAFHMQDFHACTRAVDKDVNVPVLYVATHLVGHHSAQGVKAPAHIGWIRIQVIPHDRCEAEHPIDALKSTVTLTTARLATRSVLHALRSDSLFHRIWIGVWLQGKKRLSTVVAPGLQSAMTGLAHDSQKPPERILF
jgi:hypothetical protein